MELEAFIVRVTIFQEQDQGYGSGRRMSSGTIGEFLIPCCDPSVNMHFDFKKPVSGRVFIFEVVGSQRKGSTGSVEESRAVSASAREFEGMHSEHALHCVLLVLHILFLDLLDHVERASRSGAHRQLHQRDDRALVFIGQE